MNNLTIFSRVSFLDKLLFTKHLSVMVKAGIPLAEAVEILKKQTQNPAFKKVLLSVSDDINNGQSLQKSLGKHPKVFDSLYLSLISVGEQSGNLEGNLEYLALELAKSYEFKQKVRGAMLYPAFVVLIALLVGGGIALFVLPQLVNLFSSLGANLPLSTRILIAFANLMKNHGPLIFIGLIGLISLIGFIVNTPPIKPSWHTFLLKLPIFGAFLINSESANFCRNLGLMLKSGLPINRALIVVRDSTSNLVFRSYIDQIGKAVEKGKSIESELDSNRYQLLPPIISKMVGVGERTGKLDETLLYLGDFFAEEVDSMAKNFPTILEPILLVSIAALVAFLSFAIISPIYEFTSSIHR